MKNTRITTNAREIVNNKTERNKAIFVYTSNENYFLYKGDKIKESHFNMMFPITPVSTVTYL